MPHDIFKKFSQHSRNALRNAYSLALEHGQSKVGPEHILYGLSQESGSMSEEILRGAKVHSSMIKEIVTKRSTNRKTDQQMSLGQNAQRLLERSVLIASRNQHHYVGTEHLLAATLEINDPKLNHLFNLRGISQETIRQRLETVMESCSRFPDLSNALDYLKDRQQEEQEHDHQVDAPSRAVEATPTLQALDYFATHLTDRTVQQKIDPVIGRETEIDRLIQILSRRTKNNPILLGDPGVGKTAIVEGLAKRIINDDVPDVLRGKKIYSLDLSLVVAGTSFRGEFENRLKQITSELKKNPDIILFIDELHTITGAGAATGSMDAANILKPALARGEIRCIGATTMDDYKKHIESDAALERRFQPIQVDQPNIEKTIQILHGIKHNYEKFHRVTITDDAIEAAANLSERYLPERFLPDKAIDLVDEAASAMKIKSNDVNLSKIRHLEQALEMIRSQKDQSLEAERFQQALDQRKIEDSAVKKLDRLKATQQRRAQQPLGTITRQDIVGILSKMTGVPLQELMIQERNRLLKLEQLLNSRVIGQENVTTAVAESIRRSRVGITDTTRPIGSFIFLGPSGVGKTLLAQVLAQTVFGNADALIKIDMSEFSESFSASKLIGAPAGYVGYRDGAKLTDGVKRRPYSVVLFDEIEKAHSQIFNLLLQVLEDGYLTDATGKKIF